MKAWPSLDGAGLVWLCPRCPEGQPGQDSGAAQATASGPPPPPPTQPRAGRLRDLIKPSSDGLPESLLEDLPEEARRALAPSKPEKSAPSPVEQREGMVESLRRQGYVITEDAKGIRIGGRLDPKFAGTNDLRPSDIIRLAAEMDGGVPPPEKRLHCPKCDAVVVVGSARCQWCGTTFAPGTKGP